MTGEPLLLLPRRCGACGEAFVAFCTRPPRGAVPCPICRERATYPWRPGEPACPVGVALPN